MMSKTEIYKRIQEKYLSSFDVVEHNWEKPWGGYMVIDSRQIETFINTFFQDLPQGAFDITKSLSPKLLIVEAHKRLSWQYHHRRAEWWKAVQGSVGVSISKTDEEPLVPRTYVEGKLIRIPLGARHRLIGLDSRGVVAEIWEHTDPNQISDEQDIVRVQDDFGR